MIRTEPWRFLLRSGKALRRSLLLGAAVILPAGSAHALLWEWRFSAPDSPSYGTLLAEGLLRTTSTPDSEGFFTILEASGERNGVAISSLLPIDSSIPGNTGYFSDNLVRSGSQPLTSSGFNVRYTDFSYSNFFTVTYLSPVVDMEFHSPPPYNDPNTITERPGMFLVRQVPVPVPGPLPLAGASLALAWSRRLRHSQRRTHR